jgi:hypothetical protein
LGSENKRILKAADFQFYSLIGRLNTIDWIIKGEFGSLLEDRKIFKGNE